MPDRLDWHWGIYAIVLEKAGSDPIVYVGSATNGSRGLAQRMYQYDVLIHVVPP